MFHSAKGGGFVPAMRVSRAYVYEWGNKVNVGEFWQSNAVVRTSSLRKNRCEYSAWYNTCDSFEILAWPAVCPYRYTHRQFKIRHTTTTDTPARHDRYVLKLH